MNMIQLNGVSTFETEDMKSFIVVRFHLKLIKFASAYQRS